ncbi:MAG: class I SAM-dependent methyltransferase [Deltaproteobacteria bacterium]|nr:class I SAM-dependent methyltransferase [Deltaproteobacteria bacterium]
MERLTEEKFWDDSYAGRQRAVDEGAAGRSLKARLKQTALYRAFHELERSYANHFVWNMLMPRYLPRGSQYKLVEVGSAPGHNLITFRRNQGYQVYGVEYTEHGVELNRRLFAEHGIDPAQVIHQDFFSDAFQRQYAGAFDVAFSDGFIEHFGDPAHVVGLHVNLVRPGGYVAIDIPNFRGMGGVLMRLMDPSLFEVHNLDLMTLEGFRQAFAHPELEPLYCGYAGTYNLKVLDNRDTPLKTLFTHARRVAQMGLDAALIRAGFGGYETAFFSPYLVYIGRRRAGA